MTCENCIFHTTASNPCQLGEGKKGSKVMVIGENPTASENDRDLTFGSISSNKMKESLVKRGIPLEDVYFTYALKCPVPEGTKIKQSHITACKEYLDAEIELVNPQIIVPLGNSSSKMVLNKTGITRLRGRAVEVDGRIIMPTFHPRDINRKPGYKPLMLEDLDKLKELYDNGMNEVKDVEYKVLEDVPSILREIKRLEKEAEWLVFDLETTGKNPFLPGSKVVCISLTDKERYGVSIPLLHRESTLKNENLGIVVKHLRRLLQNPSIKKAAHNGKFDMKWLEANLDIYVANYAFDTMLAHYIAVSEEQGFQSLKLLAWTYTDMGGFDNELDEYKDKLPESERYNYDNIPWSILSKYASCDADCCFRLMKEFTPLLNANEKWVRIFNEIMIPGSYSFKDIETFGMKMNEELAEEFAVAYGKELKRISDQMYSFSEVIEMEREKLDLFSQRQALMQIPKKERTPEEQKFVETSKKYQDYKFNFNSVPQLQELLFDRIGLTTSYTTDTGGMSTKEESLEEMSKQHELPKTMMEFRKVNTLNNMFITKLPPLLDHQGIVHPSFNLSGTVTARLSSEEPNAQQFPRASENYDSFQYKYEPKRLFVSRFGNNGCILQLDYSQLELRIAGTISRDKNLLQAFQSGEDIHKATASLVWGVPISEVTKDMRTNAKAVNFGIIYGKSEHTFARDLYGHLPWDEALQISTKLVRNYMDTFYGLGEWIKDTHKFARKYGYVENLFGMHRRLPDIRSKDKFLKSEAERQAQNTPIQGTGAQMTILSCIKGVEYLKYGRKLKSMIISSVHDSIVLDVYLPELEEVLEFMRTTMETIHKPYFDDFGVPYKADAEVGGSYGRLFGIDNAFGLSHSKSFRIWLVQKEAEKEEEIRLEREKKAAKAV